MSKVAAKPLHFIKDIWVAYAEKLLKQNPGWCSRYHNKIKHYYLGYMKGEGKNQVFVQVFCYAQFRRVLEFYFDRAKAAIIAGEAVNLNGKLGKIVGMRIERDFRSPGQKMINWDKTRKIEKVWDPVRLKMAYPKMVYYTSNDYCRIGWLKNRMVENETVYKFSPTEANASRTTGFKLEFSQAQEKDPLLKYIYLYQPLSLNKEKLKQEKERKRERALAELAENPIVVQQIATP